MAVRGGRRGDGDGWVHCTCGSRHWGRYGAAGLLLFDPSCGVLLQRRADWSHHGGTWGVPGGALNSSESAHQAALREAAEEAAVPPESVLVTAESTMEHGPWRYTTVLASATGTVRAEIGDWESAEVRWVPVPEIGELPLLPAFGAAWPALREELGSQIVLVVDVANVMGSRPDGWWRDRPAAAARLRDGVATLGRRGVPADELAIPPRRVPPAAGWRWWPRVIVVVEGQAKGVDAVDGVEVVAATQDGDSAIVDVAYHAAQDSARVLVATADRELSRRITAVGAQVLRPKALLRLLEGR